MFSNDCQYTTLTYYIKLKIPGSSKTHRNIMYHNKDNWAPSRLFSLISVFNFDDSNYYQMSFEIDYYCM